MDQQSIDLLAKFAGPAATVIASVTAAGVAIAFGISQYLNAKRQVKIASDKLALDLFQRRIDVVAQMRLAVGNIAGSGASSSMAEQQLIEAMDAARFLFGHEVRAYLEGMYQSLIELDYCNTSLKDPNLSAGDRGKIAQRRTDHFKAITSFQQRIDGIFGPYLSAEHIRFIE